ncbi:hypothetical protein, partial [Aquicoccus sp.]|uniref:hypothetical protein n=1 Tax=Aquicoccus sp. TaxID=2055851 RepID=UPI00356A9FB0
PRAVILPHFATIGHKALTRRIGRIRGGDIRLPLGCRAAAGCWRREGRVGCERTGRMFYKGFM